MADAAAIARAHLDRLEPVPRGWELPVLEELATSLRGRVSPLEQLTRLSALALRCEAPPPVDVVLAIWRGENRAATLDAMNDTADKLLEGIPEVSRCA